MERTTSHSEANAVFDQAVDDLIALHSTRYSVIRYPLPKSNEWFAKILPTFDDRRFKIF
jgi:hypothetical protein